MLTEQDFYKIIDDNIWGLEPNQPFTNTDKAAKEVHSQHLAECERLMEIAFNAGNETTDEGRCDIVFGYASKFKTFQDFKDSLNKTESSV